MGLALIDGGQFSRSERWLVDGTTYAYEAVAEAVNAFGTPVYNVPATKGRAYVEFELETGQLTIALEPVDDLLADTAITVIFSDDVPESVATSWLAKTYVSVEARAGLVVREDAAA